MANTFFDNSIWGKLQKETRQDAEFRQKVIKKLENDLGAFVVTLFTSFDKDAIIDDNDAEMIENILAHKGEINKLVLVINSPGGDALAAERIVNICRAYSKDNFEVLVPHMAKSAATMICFGSNKILMAKSAELGPVDPQITYVNDAGVKRYISAEEYIRSYETLMEQASSGEAKRIEPFLQQLNRYDSREIEQFRSHAKAAEDISISLLKEGMMSKKAVSTIKKDINIFLSQQGKSSHGRMISADEAKGMGLEIDLIELGSTLWKNSWELFVRTNWMVSSQSGNNCGKVIETSDASVMLGARN